jgi:AcrR family transcriptional regulator
MVIRRSRVKRGVAGSLAQPAALERSTTKQQLIDAGEYLLAHRGIDAVSLREIAEAANQSNNVAVQYHFQDRAGLVRAILMDRIEQIETLHRDHLQALPARAGIPAEELLKILWLPILSIRDKDGRYTFCRFLLQCMLHPQMEEAVIRSTYENARGPGHEQLRGLVKVAYLLRSCYSYLPAHLLDRRLSALSMMFLATVVEYDNARHAKRQRDAGPFEAQAIIKMALAALAAAP